MKLGKDLHAFIELLNAGAVEYVVVGGYAVGYHGYPRYTGDIDFLLRPSPDNAERVLRAIDDFGFGGLGITLEDLTSADSVIQLGQPPNRIDLLTAITGVTVDEVFAHRVAGALDGLSVHYIGREQLLRNKRATGRRKDIEDADLLDD